MMLKLVVLTVIAVVTTVILSVKRGIDLSYVVFTCPFCKCAFMKTWKKLLFVSSAQQWVWSFERSPVIIRCPECLDKAAYDPLTGDVAKW